MIFIIDLHLKDQIYIWCLSNSQNSPSTSKTSVVCVNVEQIHLYDFTCYIYIYDFYLRRGDFIMYLVRGQPKDPLQKNKSKIKTFKCFGMQHN